MLTSPYELRGIEKGMQQGMQQGMVAGQREMLLHLLRTRFGNVPEALVARVESLTRPEELTALLDRALNAQNLEELAS